MIVVTMTEYDCDDDNVDDDGDNDVDDDDVAAKMISQSVLIKLKKQQQNTPIISEHQIKPGFTDKII